MKRLTPWVLAIGLLVSNQVAAHAWTTSDVVFEDIHRAVKDPPDGAAEGNIPGPPGMQKSQGIVYAHGNCGTSNECDGVVVKKLVRTYTKQPGDGNYTATVTGYAYVYVELATGNSASGSARFMINDHENPDHNNLEMWSYVRTRTTPGSESVTVEFDKTLTETTTLRIPMMAFGRGVRTGTPPVGTAYGYANCTVTYPVPP
jgi:hypothetical protein